MGGQIDRQPVAVAGIGDLATNPLHASLVPATGAGGDPYVLGMIDRPRTGSDSLVSPRPLPR